MFPEAGGTMGGLPEGTSQPDDPGGVGGFIIRFTVIIIISAGPTIIIIIIITPGFGKKDDP